MTFDGIDEEMKLVWEKPKEVLLFKLYDKVSNLLDASWMASGQRITYIKYTKRLLRRVQRDFGDLNITKVAKQIVKH